MQLSDRKASASAVCFRISTKHKVAAAEADFVQPPQKGDRSSGISSIEFVCVLGISGG